jgi:hypothetical protein
MAYSQPPRVKARLPDMRLKNKYFLLDFYPDLKQEIHRPPGAASWPNRNVRWSVARPAVTISLGRVGGASA